MEAILQWDAKMILGEGPIWHPTENVLYGVDIEGCSIFRFDPVTKESRRYQLGERVGVAIPTVNGKFIVGLERGIAFFDPLSDQLEFVSSIESEILRNRFNDGKCDVTGRLWAGTMDMDEKAYVGALYSYDGKNVEKHLSEIGISNGIAWSPDLATFYYIDSSRLEVKAFDFDQVHGKISNPRVIIKVDASQGFPDGMTIDQEGKLWIAHWGGSCIRKWDPEKGVELQKIDVPAPHTTSCIFGGPAHDTLFVTTARIGLTEAQLEEYPLSGGLFSIKPEVSGRQVNLFRD